MVAWPFFNWSRSDCIPACLRLNSSLLGAYLAVRAALAFCPSWVLTMAFCPKMVATLIGVGGGTDWDGATTTGVGGCSWAHDTAAAPRNSAEIANTLFIGDRYAADSVAPNAPLRGAIRATIAS